MTFSGMYTARLRNIPTGYNWDKACKYMPITIHNQTFEEPASCDNKVLSNQFIVTIKRNSRNDYRALGAELSASGTWKILGVSHTGVFSRIWYDCVQSTLSRELIWQ